MPITAEGYTIAMMCDCCPLLVAKTTVYGENKVEAFKQVKRQGWLVDRKTKAATCSVCVKNRQPKRPVAVYKKLS